MTAPAIHKDKSNLNQRGMVSIVVTVILMIVLTLIVLSFSKISRREQRNALDHQLSTQAFYAAESGINDAKTVIQNWYNTGSPNLSLDFMDDCEAFSASSATDPIPMQLNQPLSPGSEASYTCVFADPSPRTFEYTATDAQVIFPFNPENVGDDLVISWDDGNSDPLSVYNAALCPHQPGLNPQWSNSCMIPVLRIEIADLATGTTKVVFAYDGSIDGYPSFSTLETGLAVTGSCVAGNTPHECRVSIDDVPAGVYVRIKSIYGPAGISISSSTGSELTGGQAVIDVTGKAVDVMRRFQVRIPLKKTPVNPPPFGVEATDKVCKRFSIDGGSTAFDEADPKCWFGADPD